MATYWKPVILQSLASLRSAVWSPQDTEALKEATSSVKEIESESGVSASMSQETVETLRSRTAYFCFPVSHTILPQKAGLLFALWLTENKDDPWNNR